MSDCTDMLSAVGDLLSGSAALLGALVATYVAKMAPSELVAWRTQRQAELRAENAARVAVPAFALLNALKGMSKASSLSAATFEERWADMKPHHKAFIEALPLAIAFLPKDACNAVESLRVLEEQMYSNQYTLTTNPPAETVQKVLERAHGAQVDKQIADVQRYLVATLGAYARHEEPTLSSSQTRSTDRLPKSPP